MTPRQDGKPKKRLSLAAKRLMLERFQADARNVLEAIYAPENARAILLSFRDDPAEVIAIAARDLVNSMRRGR
jgi:hypothetical protein